jgi:hypothetical protein
MYWSYVFVTPHGRHAGRKRVAEKRARLAHRTAAALHDPRKLRHGTADCTAVPRLRRSAQRTTVPHLRIRELRVSHSLGAPERSSSDPAAAVNAPAGRFPQRQLAAVGPARSSRRRVRGDQPMAVAPQPACRVGGSRRPRGRRPGEVSRFRTGGPDLCDSLSSWHPSNPSFPDSHQLPIPPCGSPLVCSSCFMGSRKHSACSAAPPRR